jgi:hypothetical protein
VASGNKKERVPGGPLSKPLGSSDRYEVSMTDEANIADSGTVARGLTKRRSMTASI